MSSSTTHAPELTDNAPTISQPPLQVNLRISSPTISLSGNTPFITTTVYTSTASRPIWALINLFSDFADGIVVRDPNHWKGKNRRIGCSTTMNQDEWDEDELEREDTKLVRLEPGEKFETTYTFATEPKIGGMRPSDVHYMKEDREYFVELGRRKCRWMYENEMEGSGLEERREVLKSRKIIEWKPDCKVYFRCRSMTSP